MQCTDRTQSQSDTCLQQFFQKTQLSIGPESRQLCVHALNLMSRSRDTLHARDHIYRLLQDLMLWLRTEPGLKQQLQHSADVLVLAICCHDLWKSQRIHKHGILHYLWGCVWDGPGSARIFRQLARDFRLSAQLIQETAYTIRVHSGTQLRPRKTLSARMLNDLDVLDYLSPERMDAVKALIDRQPRWRQRLIDKIRGPIDLMFGPNSLKHRYAEWADHTYRQRSLSAFANIGLLPHGRELPTGQTNYQTS